MNDVCNGAHLLFYSDVNLSFYLTGFLLDIRTLLHTLHTARVSTRQLFAPKGQLALCKQVLRHINGKMHSHAYAGQCSFLLGSIQFIVHGIQTMCFTLNQLFTQAPPK